MGNVELCVSSTLFHLLTLLIGPFARIYNGICFTGLALRIFQNPIIAAWECRESKFSNRLCRRRPPYCWFHFLAHTLSLPPPCRPRHPRHPQSILIPNSLVALQAGGYTHPCKSAYVLCTLIVGVLLIISFIIWEWKGTKHPMIPHELFAGPRIIALAYAVAFVFRMKFYSLLNFFPLSFETTYNPDSIQVGLKALRYGISVTAGAIFFNVMLSFTKNHNRELLLTAAAIMSSCIPLLHPSRIT